MVESDKKGRRKMLVLRYSKKRIFFKYKKYILSRKDFVCLFFCHDIATSIRFSRKLHFLKDTYEK